MLVFELIGSGSSPGWDIMLCSCLGKTVYSHSVSLHLVNLMLGITTVASHPGERRILLVASCYTYHDELA